MRIITGSVLFAASLLLGLTACQKEPDANLLGGPNPGTPACSLQYAEYYDQSGAVSDTAGFVYNGTSVQQVNYQDYFITLTYSGSRVSQRNYYDYNQPTVSVGFDAFSYNGDGTLSRAQFYIEDSSLNAPLQYAEITFLYSGGHLSQMAESIDTAFSGNLIPLLLYNYTYTANNITRCISTYLPTAQLDTLDYVYDTQSNYYAMNPSTLYSDNLFSGMAGELLPFIWSANNVTVLRQSGGDYNVTYATDTQGNLTEFRINGQLLARYTYKCQ